MISLIAAIGKNRELGFGNKLLWHLPDDLKRFRELTKGHTVIMGSKTYASIGRLLPERRNVILSRDPAYSVTGATVVHSIEKALKATQDEDEVFVIGGGEVYKLAFPYADKMYLTIVDATPQADVFFPDFDEHEWWVVHEEPHGADATHAYPFVFRIYEKKK